MGVCPHICPWVGPHAPSFGRQLSGLPSRVEYLSPQGVMLPLVYGTTTSLFWLELRGLSAWQATPSWTVYRLACQRLLQWLRPTFAMVPDPAWLGSDQWPWGTAPAAGLVGRLCRPSAPDPWDVGSFLSLGRPRCARVCGVLGHLAPVHRCARLVRCFACAVSWSTWLLFTGVPARCVVLLVRCPGPLGSCSLVCPRGVLLCVCGVLGHLAPVHRCARPLCCLCVRCPGPLGSCSPVCALGALLCVCGVLVHLAPVHRCARLVRCVACAVSWTTWLLFTGVPARCVALLVRCPGPLGSCSPLCPPVVLPVCVVSWATWLLFTGVPAWCLVFLVRCPGPVGSCSPICPLGRLFCLCSVLGHLAPAHRRARLVRCFACAVS